MPLTTSKEMFAKAYDGGYAVGAFNVNNMETIQGIVEAGVECRSPLILQVSNGARKYAKMVYLKKLVEAAVEDSGLPICLHLDHGDSFELCKQCVDDGFTSVMIDASKLPFDQNIELSKKVAEYAHARGVVVEAELGTLAGVEEHVSNKYGCFTNPDEVEEFVSKTGVDSLAIAIGTSHGAFKFKGEAKLRFDILEEIAGRLPKFPIVLHGASSASAVCPHNQRKRRQYVGSAGRTRGDAQKSRHVRRMQNQHRQRHKIGVHRNDKKVSQRQSRPFRPQTIPLPRPRGDKANGKAQNPERARKQRQNLVFSSPTDA